MSTQIFVMTHKLFKQPRDPVYVPLHVGKALSEDLGYMGDDTGDNISDLNGFYGELTGLYWLWANYQSEGNIGICHYRRFFIGDEGFMLSGNDYDEILNEYDIITSQAVTEELPYMEYYGNAHNKHDLELEGQVIREIFPDYYDAFVECMNGKTHYFGNLMVTSKSLFDEYAQWLFTIFAELGDKIDVSSYDIYHRRIYGFLSEQLLMVWIKARGLKVYECQVGIFDEKAETRELKVAINELIKQKRIKEAKEMFYGILKIRPDISLEHSDLNGDIPVIAKLLDILEKEEMSGMHNLLDRTDDLWGLLDIVRKME